MSARSPMASLFPNRVRPATPSYAVYDTYARPDNPASIGIASSGAAYSTFGHTFGILGANAYCPSPAVNQVGGALLVCPSADFDLRVTIGSAPRPGQGIVGRLDTGSPAITGWTLWYDGTVVKLEDRFYGTNTVIGSVATTLVTGDVLRLVFSGNNVTGYLNGAVVGATVSAHFNADAHAGLWALGTWDVFPVSVNQPSWSFLGIL